MAKHRQDRQLERTRQRTSSPSCLGVDRVLSWVRSLEVIELLLLHVLQLVVLVAAMFAVAWTAIGLARGWVGLASAGAILTGIGTGARLSARRRRPLRPLRSWTSQRR